MPSDPYEQYLAYRKTRSDAQLAEWELDKPFVILAHSLWPKDIEASALRRESNRARMRLRHEGFRAIAQAKRQVEALHLAASYVLSEWGFEPPVSGKKNRVK